VKKICHKVGNWMGFSPVSHMSVKLTFVAKRFNAQRAAEYVILFWQQIYCTLINYIVTL
jgi:hypothetical protein